MAEVICCDVASGLLYSLKEQYHDDPCVVLVAVQDVILTIEEVIEEGGCSDSAGSSILSTLNSAETALQSLCSSPLIPDITFTYLDNTPLVKFTGNCGKLGAKTVLNDGGTMLWGNVCWPTRQPAISHLQYDPSGESVATDFREEVGYNLKLQLEYSTVDGNHLGPPIYFTDCETDEELKIKYLTVEYQGGAETGVLIWVKDVDGEYKLYERIKVGRITGGNYVSLKPGDTETAMTFDYVRFDNSFLPEDDVPEETICICEANSIFMSDTNRPWSITFDQIKITNDKEVRALAKARIAEEESIASYNAYAFTERGVYAFQRSGRVYQLDSITNSFGVDLNAVNGALYTVTKDGIAFQGTDNRLHYMTGRQIVELDTTVRPSTVREECYLWSELYDLEYDVHNNEIYVLTDTGVWVYNFEYQGWIANYDFSLDYGQQPISIYYQTNDAVTGGNNRILFLFGNGLIEVNDGKGEGILSNPYIVTQPIFEGVEKIYPKMLKLDYEKIDDDTLAQVEHWLNYTSNEKGCGFEDSPLQSYKIPPGRPRYPKARGRGHVMRISNFKELRELGILAVQSRGNN